MYLVVGANGFLGSYVLKNILESTNEEIVATTRNIDCVSKGPRISWVSCDVAEFSQVDSLLHFIKSKTHEMLKVVYCAAYHNPDLVEENPRVAWNINVTSLSYFLNRLENVACLFYPSTDSVYGESVDGYHFSENDALKPVNTYGKQKVVAEQLVRGCGYNVVRYPFLISPSLSPVKKHFYDKIVNDLQQGKKLEMFKDSLRSTISFNQAANLLVKLMESYSEALPKTMNVCGDDDLSKYDVGVLLARKLNISDDMVVPISICDKNEIFKAKRASSTLMSNALIKKVLNLSNISLQL